MCCEGEIDEENEEYVKAGEEGPGMSEDELQPERGYSYGSERAATERYPTYRDSGPGATRTELPDAGEGIIEDFLLLVVVQEIIVVLVRSTSK